MVAAASFTPTGGGAAWSGPGGAGGKAAVLPGRESGGQRTEVSGVIPGMYLLWVHSRALVGVLGEATSRRVRSHPWSIQEDNTTRFHEYVESKKPTKKNKLRCREEIGVPRWRGAEGQGNGERLTSYRWPVIEAVTDAKHRTGNIARNAEVTRRGARWYQTHWDDHFIRCVHV